MVAAERNDPNWQAPPGVQRFRLSELSAATLAGAFDKAYEIGMDRFEECLLKISKMARALLSQRGSGHVNKYSRLGRVRNEVG